MEKRQARPVEDLKRENVRIREALIRIDAEFNRLVEQKAGKAEKARKHPWQKPSLISRGLG
jgi:hypothetical protein